jgi:beta-glucosidase/6-phospho-beta-glucosidase/beta-galactosidase
VLHPPVPPEPLAPSSPTFRWATGIEDTFITAPWPPTGRTLDEYELTQHYQRWESDLALIAELGVREARYGVPWHRVNPAPATWDWEWADRPLERLLALGVSPIVDLVHYGTPSWLEGAFLNPDYAERVAEYAGRLAERFAGRVRWYTPLNEPRITAWYAGYLGWWPPHRRGWLGFLAVLLAACRGIVRTVEMLRAIDPAIALVHVDAGDLYVAGDSAVAEEAERRQQIGFLALDLIGGRVTSEHPLVEWLMRHGIPSDQLEWFLARPVSLDVIGLNLYPMFSLKRLVATPRGRRIRMPYASGALVTHLTALYWERYQRPVMITETAARGSVARRRRWLEDSVAAVRSARAAGIPVVGYTWWPLFALVAWAYRQGHRPVADYLEQFGLWDLQPDRDGNLDRVRTPLVDAYRALVAGGTQAVGNLTNLTPVPHAPRASEVGTIDVPPQGPPEPTTGTKE